MIVTIAKNHWPIIYRRNFNANRYSDTRLVPSVSTTMTSIKEEIAVLKRSIVLAGRKTSVSLEDAFWLALKEIAIARGMTLSTLVATIDTERQHGNLSSAIRLFVLATLRASLSLSTASA